MRKILIAFTICITAAVTLHAQDPYITTPGQFGQTYMSYQLSENILYSGVSRYSITSTVNQSNVQTLVNGRYDDSVFVVAAGQSATITIDFSAKGSGYVQKPGGYIYLNFYDMFYCDSITATLYDSTGGDDGLDWTDFSNASTTSPYLLFRAHIPDWISNLQKIVIRVKSRASVATKISEIEYLLEQPGQYESGLFTKFGNNTIWSDLVIKDTGNVQRAFVKSTGLAYFQKLGIGTTNTNDTAKLFVEGQIRARQVKVDEDAWPDYVFAKDYKLPSLQNIQQFIKENNHLPGIPSAGEIQTKGLDLGQNQAALMQKVEELTLYLIRQEQQIKEQQKQINELKKLLPKRRNK
jgi:hypothetical protein